MSNRRKQELPDAIIIRGRSFNKHELRIIQRLVRKHFDQGRTFISKRVCETLNWRQPNGWLKDRACRDVLRQLEELNIVVLPDSKVKTHRSDPNFARQTYSKPTIISELPTPIIEYPTTLSLQLAKGNSAEQVWNRVVDTHHYLGHKVVVGRCLKYLIKADGELVAAICFSSSAWHLAARNKLLTKFIKEEEIRDLVINNSRFMILPHVRVPNLASKILALATRQVVNDWTDYYSVTPQFVETFVDSDRFPGTCYKAANWLEIGMTKGYAKKGASYHNSQRPKQIYIYGLTKTLRKQLLELIQTQRQCNG
ncbi:Druantia anti-phage system protein DruA [Kallotenue papyrolyticum]|uniref:Druantia anti-phage system protein DruA n=1 Tax=Kallotenue papyrolyticum TaxID=1325125 RepID=UPI0009DF4198|nr:Druantia anti-phage system protein DruA [Kallotenue papyrolyticum]